MKKLQIILCVLLLGSISVNAQKKKSSKNSAKPKVEFGVKAGANISKVNGYENTYVFGNKIGYYGGFVANYPLSKAFSIQGEVYYNMIGASVKNHDGKSPFKGNANMDYISVPVLAQYKFTSELYVETGPELNYNLSSKIKGIEGRDVIDMTEYNKKMVFSWGIGAGYFFNENIAANFRANIGITTPFIDSGNGPVDQFKMNNFQLGLLYFF